MFDPSTARWMSEDPASFGAGDADLYRYVGNSPTNEMDPSGLAEVREHSGTFYGVWGPIGSEGDQTFQVNVNVTSNAVFSGEAGWLKIDVNTKVTNPAKFQFIQFVYTIRKDFTTGKIVPGGRIKLKDGRYMTYADSYPYAGGDAQTLDVGNRTSTFFGVTSYTNNGRTKSAILYDSPTVDEISEPELNVTDFKEIRSVHDTFITDGERVYYYVHWERVGYYDGSKWTIKYENVYGMPVGENTAPLAGAILGSGPLGNPLAPLPPLSMGGAATSGGPLPSKYLNDNGKLRLGFEKVDDNKKPINPLEISPPIK
jgi:hypothetical protein